MVPAQQITGPNWTPAILLTELSSSKCGIMYRERETMRSYMVLPACTSVDSSASL